MSLCGGRTVPGRLCFYRNGWQRNASRDTAKSTATSITVDFTIRWPGIPFTL
ncbi:hypothetical protein KCP73_08000 [Salmonella enterica subsp. enterica]|nr:hypothetical protein KCP73_08000 [Salmonella enterica subsp. enterica]